MGLNNNKFSATACVSETWRIWIAGDFDDARRCLRNLFAEANGCAAVQRADFVYTGGEESGVCVTVINYPRFPLSPGGTERVARDLGHRLCEALCQSSFTLEGPTESHYVSRRDAGPRHDSR